MLTPPPDFLLEVSRRGSWTVIAASYRGPLHVENGAPRQDAFAVFERDGTLCVAVADGVSTSSHSDRGAAFACAQGAQLLGAPLQDGYDRREFFATLRRRFADHAREERLDAECLATTIQYLRLDAEGGADYMRLGDGAGVLFGADARWLGRDDGAAMGVANLATRGAERHVQWEAGDDADVDAFMLFTDGLEPLFRWSDGRPHLPNLMRILEGVQAAEPGAVPALVHRVMSTTDGDLKDDRTLVIGLRDGAAPVRPRRANALQPPQAIPEDARPPEALPPASALAAMRDLPAPVVRRPLFDRPEVMLPVTAVVVAACVVLIIFTLMTRVLPPDRTPPPPDEAATVEPRPVNRLDAIPPVYLDGRDEPGDPEPAASPPLRGRAP